MMVPKIPPGSKQEKSVQFLLNILEFPFHCAFLETQSQQLTSWVYQTFPNIVISSFKQKKLGCFVFRSISMEGTNPSSPEANRRIKRQGDRISALPEGILLHILSFLPTRDAIKTGVLSKTWSNIWTFLPSLSFEDSFFDDDFDDFASAVDGTLKLHRAPTKSQLSLQFYYYSTFKPRVDGWVQFAISAKVQQLRLYLLGNLNSDTYKLPQHLYLNEFITALDLRLCDIVPDGPVNWTSLKRLSITCTALTNDAMRKVLLGSPRLEFLELYDLYESWVDDEIEPIQQLNIESASLKKLVIRGESEGSFSEWDATQVFEIVAPNIQALEISGDFWGKKCRLKNVASLVEAKIDFEMFMSSSEDDYYEDAIVMVKSLLKDLHHVKELTVGCWCVWVLSIISAKHVPLPLSKCKCLTVKTVMEKWDLLGIISLLQSSPFLETLVIDMSPPLDSDLDVKYSSKSFFNSYNYDGESYWKSKVMFLECLRLHLKTVEFCGCRGWFYSNELFILLTQFLLKNSRVLEKMVIRNLRFLNVAQKLLSFPRCSPHAMVVFP